MLVVFVFEICHKALRMSDHVRAVKISTKVREEDNTNLARLVIRTGALQELNLDTEIEHFPVNELIEARLVGVMDLRES